MTQRLPLDQAATEAWSLPSVAAFTAELDFSEPKLSVATTDTHLDPRLGPSAAGYAILEWHPYPTLTLALKTLWEADLDKYDGWRVYFPSITPTFRTLCGPIETRDFGPLPSDHLLELLTEHLHHWGQPNLDDLRYAIIEAI